MLRDGRHVRRAGEIEARDYLGVLAVIHDDFEFERFVFYDAIVSGGWGGGRGLCGSPFS
jgi:hypothetical protein